MSLDEGPLSISRDNMVETLQCVLELHRMVSCTIMPNLAPKSLITSYVFQMVFMVCLFKVCRMKTRQDLSSSGIMSAFIMPIRSKTGLLLIPIFLLSACLHIHACIDIDTASIQGWMCHTRRFFPWCLARENIACDVDEVSWLNPARRRDGAQIHPTITPPTNM